MAQVAERDERFVEVKKEKAALAEDLEDAQELAGHLVQSENNKMTEIDALKARIAELERER